MSNGWSKKLGKLVKTSAMSMPLILAGCTTMMGIVGINDLCNKENPDEGLIRPFHWSSADTDGSILQAKERNAEYEGICLGK